MTPRTRALLPVHYAGRPADPLTFRALAQAARLTWEELECEADGTLDRVDRVTRFTAFHIRAYLKVPHGTSEAEARRVLARVKDHCLISQSLKAPCEFEGYVDVLDAGDDLQPAQPAL